MKIWKMGTLQTIRVFSIEGQKQWVILATGRKPKGCDGPRVLTEGKTVALRCACHSKARHLGGPEESYFVVHPFSVDEAVDVIEVLHATGRDRVAVEVLSNCDSAEGESALGISQDFALDEAFRDAVGKLNPGRNSEPSLVEIISAGALYGGFSGFSRMFVRVQKTIVPAEGEP